MNQGTNHTDPLSFVNLKVIGGILLAAFMAGVGTIIFLFSTFVTHVDVSEFVKKSDISQFLTKTDARKEFLLKGDRENIEVLLRQLSQYEGDRTTIKELSTKLTQLQNEMNALQKLEKSIPIGAVVSFASENCPNNNKWEPYTQAYGKFIRGIDKNSAHPRTPGHPQSGAVGPHEHTLTLNSRWGNQPDRGLDHAAAAWGGDDGLKNRSATVTTTGGSTGGETRPENIALLFCKKIAE